jgi:glycosyltransferase involved in cell wall biosynthesis
MLQCKSMKVALVHDYLREYGGAERVVEALHEIFPDAPLYTAFVDKDALGIHWERFKDWDIRESIAAKIPGIKKIYSPLRLFAAFFFEGFDLSEYDVVISSTNMYMAKAVITQPSTLHVCYCHTPPRSLYGYTAMTDWKKNWLTRIAGELINFFMRKVDYLTAQRPDLMIANSIEIQKRIKKFYGRDSVVVYPPVNFYVPQGKVEKKRGEYYLYVNRLALAKHPEIAVRACTKLHLPLKVVGKGSLEEELQRIAGPTIEFLGAVEDDSLHQLYQGAIALLYPVEDEDFGIVPIEAMMHGVPVIAHRSGGPKETILEKKTGVFFDTLDVSGLMDAIEESQQMKFAPDVIAKHASQFRKQVFQKKILDVVSKKKTL